MYWREGCTLWALWCRPNNMSISCPKCHSLIKRWILWREVIYKAQTVVLYFYRIFNCKQIYKKSKKLLTLVMGELKTCKNLASWLKTLQDSCMNLARCQSGQKNKSGHHCFRKHLWSKFLFKKQVTKVKSMEKFLVLIQNHARILQESCKFFKSGKFFWVFLKTKLTENQMNYFLQELAVAERNPTEKKPQNPTSL